MIVQDTVPPVITLNGSSTVTLECKVDSYTEDGATASDTVDPSVSVVIGGDSVDANTLGTYVVTYDATDASGNAATQVTRTVIVQDTIPPVISGVQDIEELQGEDCAAETSVALALGVVDFCDPSPVITTTFTYPGGSTEQRNGLPDPVENFSIGVTQVDLQAVDASGNQADSHFTVTIHSRTQLAVSATAIIGHASQSLADVVVHVVESGVGSCADLADGIMANGALSAFFDLIFLSCPDNFSGVTDANGQVTIDVNPGDYVVIAGIDSNHNSVLDPDDTFIGNQMLSLGCGETRAVNLYDSALVLFAQYSLFVQDDVTITGDIAVQNSIDSLINGWLSRDNGFPGQVNSFLRELLSGEIDKSVRKQVAVPELIVGKDDVIVGNVIGDTLVIGDRASISGNAEYNDALISDSAAIGGSLITPLPLPVAGPDPVLPAFTVGDTNIIVPNRQMLSLAAGDYGNVILRNGSTSVPTVLRLEGGVYNLNSLTMGGKTRIECLRPCEIRIRTLLVTGNNSYIGPSDESGLTAGDINILADAIAGGSPILNIAFVTLGNNSTIQASVFVPQGLLWIDFRCHARGVFIGKWVGVGKNSSVTLETNTNVSLP